MLSRHFFHLLIAGLSAACGLIVEIIAGRMVAPYLGMSLYTWTAIISVVLAGFSLGHWLGGLAAQRPAPIARRAVAWSLLLAGLSTAATLLLIRIAAPFTLSLGLNIVPTVLIITTVLFFLPSLFVGIPSPALTKLAIDADPPGQTGRTIGAFFAVGAIGSIAGTLAAGFLFISWLGTTRTLFLVATTYVLMGFALFWKAGEVKGLAQLARPLILLSICAALLGYFGQKVQAFKELCRPGSSYYCIRVIDVTQNYGENARLMVLDHLGHGINLRDRPQTLVSPYVELQDTLARIHTGRRSPFRAFFIGGGAYTLPRAWLAARPDAEITVAEIDPAVTRSATERLWLTPSDRLKTLHADARLALNQLEGDTGFDIIVGDAFHDIVVPHHLVTHEFFSLVKSRLAPDGIYVMNIVDHQKKPRLALSVLETMKQIFCRVEMWRMNDTGSRTTFILAALQQPTPYASFRSYETPGVHFRRMNEGQFQGLRKDLMPLILTDDYAPVDRLIGIE
jgi:spermidine synthase